MQGGGAGRSFSGVVLLDLKSRANPGRREGPPGPPRETLSVLAEGPPGKAGRRLSAAQDPEPREQAVVQKFVPQTTLKSVPKTEKQTSLHYNTKISTGEKLKASYMGVKKPALGVCPLWNGFPVISLFAANKFCFM